MPLLSGIETRVSDMLLTPEGRHLAFSGMTHAFMGLRHIRKSQLIQDAIDHIHVKVVPGDSFTEEDRLSMVERIRNYVGERVRIDTELVDEIERDASGKYRWIISKVNPADWMDQNG
jgi:phenylacetate-CoA ligase